MARSVQGEDPAHAPGAPLSSGCGRLAPIMDGPQAADVLGHVTLVTGPEELLNQRTVSAAVAAVHAADPDSELSETTADQLSMATLGDLAAPSLFSSIRCIVVRGLEDLSDDVFDGLVDYARGPSNDIGLILVHSAGRRAADCSTGSASSLPSPR